MMPVAVNPARMPTVVAWETTRRCQLRCRHCRGAARDHDYARELTTSEGRRLIDALAVFGSPVLIFTGGEPMTRPDIYDLASYANQCGLRTVMAPCGPMLNPASVGRIKKTGVRCISVSLDGPDAETHDRFRGIPGAFKAACTGLQCCRDAGLDFQVNCTLSKVNVSCLPRILGLAGELGAKRLDVFFLVPTGRGTDLADLALSPEEAENALRWIVRQGPPATIPVKTTCAPQSARITHEVSGRPTGNSARAGHGGTGGCMAGRGFVFVSHRGILQPCGFLDLACGDLRQAGFDFAKLYRESTVLGQLRDRTHYTGKCRICGFREVCGGCRAKAFSVSGSYLDEDPSCAYIP